MSAPRRGNTMACWRWYVTVTQPATNVSTNFFSNAAGDFTNRLLPSASSQPFGYWRGYVVSCVICARVGVSYAKGTSSCLLGWLRVAFAFAAAVRRWVRAISGRYPGSSHRYQWRAGARCGRHTHQQRNQYFAHNENKREGRFHAV